MSLELEVLERLSLVLMSEFSVALEQALEIVADYLGLEGGWIWLYDAEGEIFFLAANKGLPDCLKEPLKMTGCQCRCLKYFSVGKLCGRGQVLECSRLGVRGYHATVPLVSGGNHMGVMNLVSLEWRELSVAEKCVLAVAGNQIALAVERDRLLERQQRGTREAERSRLAREIHDGLVQSFTAVTLHLESALARPEKAEERTQKALDVARLGLESARQAMGVLRETPLKGRTLSSALKGLAREFTYRTGVPVKGQINDVDGFSLSQETELYRIAQEALHNVERHAQANQVELLLTPHSLAVVDDGIGFDPDRVNGTHYGLIGMGERARLLEAELVVKSGHAGTEVRVIL